MEMKQHVNAATLPKNKAVATINGRYARLLADTAALVTFALAVGMFVEVVISGLTVIQSAQSRLMSIPLNMIAARPYGIYRDWLFARFGAERRRPVFKTLIDILAFSSFMLPQYALVLLIVGADVLQTASACLTLILLSAFIGRPYGLYLELCRRMLKVDAF